MLDVDLDGCLFRPRPGRESSISLEEACELIDLHVRIGWATRTHGDEPEATVASAERKMYANKQRRRADI